MYAVGPNNIIYMLVHSGGVRMNVMYIVLLLLLTRCNYAYKSKRRSWRGRLGGAYIVAVGYVVIIFLLGFLHNSLHNIIIVQLYTRLRTRDIRPIVYTTWTGTMRGSSIILNSLSFIVILSTTRIGSETNAISLQYGIIL